MHSILKILKFEFSNVIRSRWIFYLFVFFFGVSYLLFTFETNIQKSILSLFNLIVYLIPLVSLIFGTLYFYNSREYIEMMLCQPLSRSTLYIGLFLGTSLPMVLSFCLAIVFSVVLFGDVSGTIPTMFLLVVIGAILILLSISIAFMIATKIADKVKGLSASILFWLWSAIIYDGFLLLISFLLSDYPVEKFLFALVFFNPIDLSRIMFILNFDISALLGLTGAIFKKFFGTQLGFLLSTSSLIFWIIVPLFVGLKTFEKKDF